MSVINKKPFIKSVLDSLSNDNLVTLRTLINGGGNQTAINRTMSNQPKASRPNITVADKGVKLCNLQLETSLYNGYLIYNDDYCVLVHFTDSPVLSMFNINVAKKTLATVDEALDVVELRSELEDRLKADLVDGKVPASQLPSYVDDIVEGYYYNGNFYSDVAHTHEITPETGVIYLDLDTKFTYRWTGTEYVQVNADPVVADANGNLVINNVSPNAKPIEKITDGTHTAEISTYKTFPLTWVTNGTIAQFCASVNSDATAVAGLVYLGELTCSDLPFNGNADAEVEIIDGTGTSGKVIHVVITSGDVAPYRWEYTYWNDGSNVSGWVAFESEIKTFELSTAEYTSLTNGSTVTLASSDPRYALLSRNALRITVEGTSIAMICNKHINVNGVTAFSYADYSALTDDVKVAYLVFTPGTNSYVISRILKEVKVLAKAAIEAAPSGTLVSSLGLDASGHLVKGEGTGGGGDNDVTVEIESDYTNDSYASRSNYANPINLKDFIANCEAGLYTNAGTIAKVNNLISGKAFRLILIGTDHEVLASDDTTQVKTTWQFLDMPQHNVRLGLPFNLLDWTSGSGRAYLMEYLNGINSGGMDLYPSNMDGLISAQGLLQVCHVVYESLPDTLKRHIKTVRRYYYRRRNYMSVGANGGTETNSSQMCQLACNVFHLSRYDLFGSGQAEGSGSKYTYFNSNARRIRFYNGTATSWWNASPNTSNSYNWYGVDYDGSDNSNYTYYANGVAPAFCI